MGPFVDAQHPQIAVSKFFFFLSLIEQQRAELEVDYQQLFDDVVLQVTEALLDKTPTLQILIVPSLRDVHCDYVFPQAPIKPSHDEACRCGLLSFLHALTEGQISSQPMHFQNSRSSVRC